MGDAVKTLTNGENGPLLRLVLTAVGVGLVSIGGFLGLWINSAADRDERARGFVEELVKSEREDRKAMAQAIDKQTTAWIDFTASVTSRLDTLISDQRRFPAVQRALQSSEQE